MQEHDLEQDLHRSPVILEKVKEDRYAQNLYAAMCNRRWQRAEVWPILKSELWSCSWRYSGGIVAELQGQGDYLNWYCSGIGFEPESGFVVESTVTDEIRTDLATLGWHPVPWNDNDLS